MFEVSDRAFMERIESGDVQISHDGRVMEVLSEHNCHGWLEGYTLTGLHGLFATYETFAVVSASQTVQHTKWLEEAVRLPWRARIPSLNALLTSTCCRNEHNGFPPRAAWADPDHAHASRRGRTDLLPTGRELPAIGGQPLFSINVVREFDRY